MSTDMHGDRKEPPETPACWFDSLTGGEMAAKDAAAFELDDFAAEVLCAPHWVLETGCQGPVLLAVHTHQRGAWLSFSADLAGRTVDIAVEPDASGWLSVTAMYCAEHASEAHGGDGCATAPLGTACGACL